MSAPSHLARQTTLIWRDCTEFRKSVKIVVLHISVRALERGCAIVPLPLYGERRITGHNTAVAILGSDCAIPVYAYSREGVSTAFGELGLANERSMAEAIAKHIPAFERYVPPPRKP
jgi:hypothetical protein